MNKPSSLHGVHIDLHIISGSRYTKEFAIDYLFEDLLVVDAATFLAGPGAATVLSDFGATVIKIEPLDGDRYRTLKGNYETDYNWLLTSRNKKSLALDLSRKRGREIVHQLVEKADILVTNFIGQYLERYELEYERLKRINPRLIYAHVSGYGDRGVRCHAEGVRHDCLVGAFRSDGVHSLSGSSSRSVRARHGGSRNIDFPIEWDRDGTVSARAHRRGSTHRDVACRQWSLVEWDGVAGSYCWF